MLDKCIKRLGYDTPYIIPSVGMDLHHAPYNKLLILKKYHDCDYNT